MKHLKHKSIYVKNDRAVMRTHLGVMEFLHASFTHRDGFGDDFGIRSP